MPQTVYFFWNAPYTFFGISDNTVFDSSFYLYLNTPLIIITNLLYSYFLMYFFTGLYNSKRKDFLIKLMAGIALFLITISIISIYVEQSNQYIFYLANLLSTGFSIYLLTSLFKRRIPKYSLFIGEKQDKEYILNLQKQDAENKTSTGVIAQEVETLAKNLNYDFDGLYKPQNDKDAYGPGYQQFITPLIKAVQQQQPGLQQQQVIKDQQLLFNDVLKRLAALENK